MSIVRPVSLTNVTYTGSISLYLYFRYGRAIKPSSGGRLHSHILEGDNNSGGRNKAGVYAEDTSAEFRAKEDEAPQH